jgi:hypothetical protein
MISDRAGHAVMWAYTLNEIFVKTGQPVTMLSIVDHFPMGFPTEEEYRACWASQKEEGKPLGNAVDDFSTWSLPEKV